MILRIPKNLSIVGDDAFVLSAYAIFLAEGNTQFLQSIGSYFGIYPFSSYPILTIFILAIFFFLTKNIIISWFLTSFTIAFLGFIFLKILIDSLEIEKNLSFLIILLYLNNPLFILYSYGSISARATFLAFMPLYYYSVNRLFSHPNINNILFVLVSTIILLLTHRVAILLIPISCIIIIISLFKITSYGTEIIGLIKFQNVNVRLFFSISLILLFFQTYIMTFITPISEQIIGTTGFFEIHPGITSTFEIILDISLRIGPISLLFLCYYFIKILDQKSELHPLEIKIVTLLHIYIFGVTYTWYFSLLILFPVTFLGCNILNYTIRNFNPQRSRFQFSNMSNNVMFLTITYFVVSLLGLSITKEISIIVVFSYTVFLIFILITYLIHLFSHKTTQLSFKILIISIILIQSSFYVDSLTFSNTDAIPNAFLSDNEIKLANFLTELNIEGRVLSYSSLIAKRIMGITGILFYDDKFGGTSLISGYIDQNDIDASIKLNLNQLLSGPYLYEFNQSNILKNIKTSLLLNSYFNQTSQFIFNKEKTEYFIISKDNSFKNEWGSGYSILFEEIKSISSNIIYSDPFFDVYYIKL